MAEQEPDAEDFRRGRNQRRRMFRRQKRRRAWLEILREKDPARAAELEEIRRHSGPEFRRELIREAKKHGFHAGVNRWVSRDLPPLAERRAEDDED